MDGGRRCHGGGVMDGGVMDGTAVSWTVDRGVMDRGAMDGGPWDLLGPSLSVPKHDRSHVGLECSR